MITGFIKKVKRFASNFKLVKVFCLIGFSMSTMSCATFLHPRKTTVTFMSDPQGSSVYGKNLGFLGVTPFSKELKNYQKQDFTFTSNNNCYSDVQFESYGKLRTKPVFIGNGLLFFINPVVPFSILIDVVSGAAYEVDLSISVLHNRIC